MAKLTVCVILLCLASVTANAVHASTGSARSFQHDVLLDGKPIGFHRFTLQDTGTGLRVEGHANFVVKLLGLKVFDYDHRVAEEWRNGCLARLDATTRQNGKTSRVEGNSSADVFTVQRNDDSKPLEQCVASFAYWDRATLLQRTSLLNPQTGEYVPVTIEHLGRQELQVANGEPLVDRYRILGKDIDITVSYENSSGQWLALESQLENGRWLQYRLRDDDNAAAAPVSPERP